MGCRFEYSRRVEGCRTDGPFRFESGHLGHLRNEAELRSHPQTALVERNPISRGQMCETKPISDQAGSWEQRIVQNEPNSWQCADQEIGVPGGQTCKTNPVWGSPAGARGRIVQNEPNFRRGRVGRATRGECAKRTQFGPRGPEMDAHWRTWGLGQGRLCKTNPILPPERGLATRGVVQTNPIPAIVPIRRSAFPGGKRAERTQFRPSPGPLKAKCAKRSQTWVGWAIWGTTHHGGRLCETNPISGYAGRTRPGGGARGAIVRNKPNSRLAPPWHGHLARDSESWAGCPRHYAA